MLQKRLKAPRKALESNKRPEGLTKGLRILQRALGTDEVTELPRKSKTHRGRARDSKEEAEALTKGLRLL